MKKKNWMGWMTAAAAGCFAMAAQAQQVRMTAPAPVDPVSSFMVTGTTDSSVDLRWYNPPSPDEYGRSWTNLEVRRSPSAITTANFSSASLLSLPQPWSGPSQLQTFTDSPLTSNVTWYYAARTFWSNGAESGLAYASGATGADLSPPAAVTDLSSPSATDGSIQLSWTAPGDDEMTGQAQQYDLRWSPADITTDAEFDAATQVTLSEPPSPAGTVELKTILGVSEGTTYCFALKTLDDGGNLSPLSNSVNMTTPLSSGDAGGGGGCLGSATGAAGCWFPALLLVLSNRPSCSGIATRSAGRR